MKHLLLTVFLLSSHAIVAQQAKREIKKMKEVNFKQPILVLFRLNSPVINAAYQLVIEEAMMSQLDTLSFYGMLSNPMIYFAKLYTSSVPGEPRRKYYLSKPDTSEELDLCKGTKFTCERLKRPRKNRFYTRKEPAKSYSTWMVRENPSGIIYDSGINTLPGVDSVRIIYVINMREKWKRGTDASCVK